MPPERVEPGTRDGRRSLKGVQAAQLRARAVKWGIGKSALGSLFLIGALAHALAPDSGARSSVFWMAALVVLSTFNIGLALRSFAKAYGWAGRYWLPATLAWGALATALVRLLLGGR